MMMADRPGFRKRGKDEPRKMTPAEAAERRRKINSKHKKKRG